MPVKMTETRRRAIARFAGPSYGAWRRRFWMRWYDSWRPVTEGASRFRRAVQAARTIVALREALAVADERSWLRLAGPIGKLPQ